MDIEESELSIQPDEVVRFMLDFNVNESTSMNDPTSGVVTVHDPTTVAVVRQRGIDIEPGFYYTLLIERQRASNLESPYYPNCFNYTGHNLWKYKEVGRFFLLDLYKLAMVCDFCHWWS